MLLLLLSVAQAWTPVAPGVETQQWTVGGPNRVSAVKVDLCASGVRVRATASGERGRRTSAWASSVGAKAAVNGGFFRAGYAPDGAAAGHGAVWSDAFDPTYRGWIGFGPRQVMHAAAGGVSWPPPAGVGEVVNGDATLVTGGAAVSCGGCGGGRAPRTAAGWTADRRVLYLVGVDGRTSSSVGMTIDQLAVFMAGLGVDRAMNLDGGGSTTVWSAAAGVMNRPSDGSERTVANHLGVLAGGGGLAVHCPQGWSAAYDGSAFAGGLTVRAEVGSVVSGALRLRNDGSFAWDPSKTRLAPLPRDQASPLASGWIAGTRITGVEAPTAPGSVGRFPFAIKVPSTPGITKHPLSVLQEGVTWFGDSWGPADGALVLTVDAVPAPAWRAEWLGLDGFPSLDGVFSAAPGEAIAGDVVVRNTGTSTWTAGLVRIGTTNPRDHVSPLHHGSWISGDRVVSNPIPVAPGETVALPVILRAPDAPGVHSDRFGLVAEGVTWFGDAGGPADGVMAVEITVEEPDTSEPVDTGSGDDTASGHDTASDHDSADDTGGPRRIDGERCGCAAAPGGGSYAALLLLLAGRRRRISRPGRSP